MVGEHRVEVLADRGGAEPQLGAEFGGGGRAPLQQKPGDPVPGAPVGEHRRTPARPLPHLDTSYFTTPTLRISGGSLQTGPPVIQNTGSPERANFINACVRCRR